MVDTLPTFEPIEIAVKDGVYTFTIRGLKSLNIMNAAVADALIEALIWLADRDDARVLVLQGYGEKAFIGGADITEMAKLTPASAQAYISRLRRVCELVRILPIPTVAMIHGYCFGVGLELAACCDVRLATTTSKFGMPEVKIGIPSVIHAALLEGLVGQGAARWLLLTGQVIDAAHAERWGLLQEVVAPEARHAALAELLAALIENGPKAARLQKDLLLAWDDDASLQKALDTSVEIFAKAYTSDEPARLMEVFINRRKESSQ